MQDVKWHTVLRFDANLVFHDALQVNSYPSSPFPTNKYVFVNKFQELTETTSKLLTRNGTAPCREVCVVTPGSVCARCSP